MNDIKSIGSGPLTANSPIPSGSKKEGQNFEDLLKEAVTKVNTVQNEAERAIQELSAGGDITNAVLAMEKADLSFQVMVQVRNKLLNAYEEIMRLQI